MPRHSAVSRIALVAAVALAAAGAGCTNSFQIFPDQNDGGWFSKKVDIFAKPDWAKATGDAKVGDLGPKGPVGPDDLVSADGRCAAVVEVPQAAAPQPPAAPPADRPVGTLAGDLGGAAMPAAATPEAGPPVLGGVGLGMTECQAVQRAGTPGNVNIGAGEKGERKVVLTYLSGPWPGIYHFADGRLNAIDRAPAPPAPPKAPPKKKIVAKKKPAIQQ